MARLLTGVAIWTAAIGAAMAPAAVAQSFTLEGLQQTARERNPTISIVQARVDAAVADTEQSSQWPNLHLAYQEEIVNMHRVQGLFARQILPISRRLSANRALHARDAELGRLLVEKQRLAVENSVRLLFRDLLVLEREVELQKEVIALEEEEVETIGQLVNVGLKDRTDLLEAEMELVHARLELHEEELELRKHWTDLAQMVGDPSLAPRPLEGDALRMPPDLSYETELTRLLDRSPELRVAQAEIAVAEAALRVERVENRPDAAVELGYRFNRGGEGDLESPDEPDPTRGWEVAFSFDITTMFWNRNQHGIRAVEADVRERKRNVERTESVLRSKFTDIFHEYEIERDEARDYLEEIVPRAEQVHALALARYEDFGEDYMEVLEARAEVLEMRGKLLAALNDAWHKVVLIEGLLLEHGLAAPNLHLLENSGLGSGEIEFM